MATKQLSEVLAMTMIGEGLVMTLYPSRHMMLWQVGPRSLKNFVREMACRPALVRVLGAVEAGLGILLAHQTLRDIPEAVETGFPPRLRQRGRKKASRRYAAT